MIDVKDEILSGEPKFRMKDANGNIIYDNLSIEMITPVVQEGTPINKYLFDTINSDIESVATESETQLTSYSGNINKVMRDWGASEKSNELEFEMGDRRFKIVSVKVIDYVVGTNTTTSGSALFLLDTVAGAVSCLTGNSKTFTGTDFNSSTPNLYQLASLAGASGNVILGIAFTGIDFEKRTFKCRCGFNSYYNPRKINQFECLCRIF